MNDICVPIPRIPKTSQAEVEVKVAGRSRSFNYRIESFNWLPVDDVAANALEKVRTNRISYLKRSIENYEKGWELVQIYNPGPHDKHIQVLFRQKS